MAKRAATIIRGEHSPTKGEYHKNSDKQRISGNYELRREGDTYHIYHRSAVTWGRSNVRGDHEQYGTLGELRKYCKDNKLTYTDHTK